MKNKRHFLFLVILALFLTFGFQTWSHAETDVTGSVGLVKSALAYNRANKTSYLDVSVRNTGSDPLLTPLKVVIDSISTSGVTVANADGVTSDGKPYFQYTWNDSLATGETTNTKRWIFSNPTQARFTYTCKVLTSTEAFGVVGSSGIVVEVTALGSPLAGARVEIPGGAIPDGQIVAIKTVQNGIVPPPDYYPAGETLELLPSGLIFNKLVDLYIPYNDRDNDGIVDGTQIPEGDVGVEVFNPSTNQWENVEIIDHDTAHKLLHVQTNHFSVWRPSINDLKWVQTKDSSNKFALQKNITELTSSYVSADLSFMNSSGAWVQISPSFDEPNYVDFNQVIVVPPVVMTGWKLFLGNIRFYDGQHIYLKVEKNQPAALCATAIDFLWRAAFGTRFDVAVGSTALKSGLTLLSSLGDTGHLAAMGGYLASGDELNASKEAVKWFFSVERNQLAAVFVNMFHLGVQYSSVMGKGLSGILFVIDAINKVPLLTELGSGYLNTPAQGFIRTQLKIIDPMPPNAPTNLDGFPLSSTEIELTWTASTDNIKVTNYRIYRGDGKMFTSPTTSFISRGLTPSTAYCHVVTAIDGASNESSRSNMVCPSTLPLRDTQAPSTPQNLSATPIASDRISLTWDASSDNVGVTGYKVYVNGSYLFSSPTNSATNWGLTSATRYCYEVSALDAAGNESALSSPPVCATTQSIPDTQAPSIPQNLSATPTASDRISLAWDASSDNVGVTEYKVYVNGIHLFSSPTSSATNWGLTPATQYCYAVSALDAAGNESAQSSPPVCAFTSVPTTPPPQLLLKKQNNPILPYPPALGDNNVFYAMAGPDWNSMGVTAFNPNDGSIIWGPMIPSGCYTLGMGISIGSNGLIYTTGDWNSCGNGRLVAYHSTDGSLAWDHGDCPGGGNTSPHPRHTPAINETLNSVYFGSTDFCSVNMDSGVNNWVVPGGYYIGGLGIAIDSNSNIIYGSYAPYVNSSQTRSLNSSGGLNWQRDFSFWQGPSVMGINNGDDIFIYRNVDYHLQGWDKNGNALWQFEDLIYPVTDAQGNIYAGSTYGSAEVVSFTSNGTERWRCPIQGATSANIQFIDNQGRVYLTDNNKKLHAIDSRTGSITWSFQADSNLLWAILAPGGKIFIQDDQSTFYWLDTQLEYAQSSWPVATYGNRRHTMKAGDNLSLPSYTDPLDEGLTAHFDFEGNIADSSPRNLVGQVYGNLTYVPGVIGNYAAKFDGSTVATFVDYFYFINSPGTMNVFINPDPGMNWSTALFDSRENYDVFMCYNNVSPSIGCNEGWRFVPVTPNQWTMITYVYPAYYGTIKIYKNAEFVAETIPMTLLNGYLGPWYHGQPYNSAIGNGVGPLSIYINTSFMGMMDDLRFYNRSLSESEIQQLYNRRHDPLN